MKARPQAGLFYACRKVPLSPSTFSLTSMQITSQNPSITGSIGDISKPEDLDSLFRDVQS